MEQRIVVGHRELGDGEPERREPIRDHMKWLASSPACRASASFTSTSGAVGIHAAATSLTLISLASATCSIFFASPGVPSVSDVRPAPTIGKACRP